MWYVIIFFFTLLEWSSYVFKAANIYACLTLSRQIILCLNLSILIWAAKMLPGVANKGHIPNV